VLTRRRFLKVIGSASALSAMAPTGFVLGGCGDNDHPFTGRFFDQHAWNVIDAATGVILPSAPDGLGARDALVVRYIDTLLAAFDVDPPAIFAGGPYSGRVAIPDAHGAPTAQFPANNFAQFVPLTRVQELAWRVRIFGSAPTPGGDFNDAITGATTGWRTLYTDGIAQLDAAAASIHRGHTYDQLSAAEQSNALDVVGSASPDFYNALLEHTLEGTFAVPEYGGNANLVGWRMVRFDGDSAPLGHAFYDATIDAYVDRADQPTSGPTPGDATEVFDDDVLRTLTVAALGSGGMRFF